MNAAFADRRPRRNIAHAGLSGHQPFSPQAPSRELAALADALEDILRSERPHEPMVARVR